MTDLYYRGMASKNGKPRLGRKDFLFPYPSKDYQLFENQKPLAA
ncbi:MAG: hypothetical protein AAFR58_08255 [Cyanobacteria bacterium J06627_28]